MARTNSRLQLLLLLLSLALLQAQQLQALALLSRAPQRTPLLGYFGQQLQVGARFHAQLLEHLALLLYVPRLPPPAPRMPILFAFPRRQFLQPRFNHFEKDHGLPFRACPHAHCRTHKT